MKLLNKTNFKYDRIKTSFLILITILFILPQKGFSQVESFIYFDNDKFMDGCEVFYPIVVPYLVTVILDIKGQYQISGYKGFCTQQGGCLSCGSDTADWHNAIRRHLSTVSEMGFNVVRLNGLSAKYDNSNTSSTYEELALSKVYVQDSLNPSCFDGSYVSYLIDSSTYERQAKLIEEFVSLVKEHNISKPDSILRITITTGTGALGRHSENYKSYLAYLGEYFKNEPTIFSWQINSEPVYFDLPKYEINKKYKKAKHFGNWYYALKTAAPDHFITFGSTMIDIFNWDAMAFPVDYVNLHNYPNQRFMFTDSTLERSNSNLKWFSEVIDKPWIVGETSIGGNDRVHYNVNNLIVTEDQQKEYANNTLIYSRWYGALGYTWWIYKEFGWFNDTLPINKIKNNYFGLVRKFNNNEEYKVAAQAFQLFNPNYICDTCNKPDIGIYYNPYGYTDLAVSGYVTDTNQIGIKNAMVRGMAKINNTIPIVFSTFTDENGFYSIFRKPDSKIWQVRTTYPGMSVETDDIKIFPGDTSIVNFQLEPLDPDLLPAPLPTADTLTIYPGQIITWDSMFIMNYHFVIVDSGAKLIIKDTIYVKPETKLIVKQGGILELDNGAIIGLCTWKGIEVDRNPASESPSDQGQLIIKNNSMIENVEVRGKPGNGIKPIQESSASEPDAPVGN